VNGNASVVVSFVEDRRPTLVRGSGDHDAPATGRAWIEASGRIDKTELSLRTANEVGGVVTAVYGAQPNLSVFVPVSMHEHYGQAFADQIEAFATYSDFVVPTVRVDVTGFKEAVDRTGRGRGGH
jgi:hypothetical protein